MEQSKLKFKTLKKELEDNVKVETNVPAVALSSNLNVKLKGRG